MASLALVRPAFRHGLADTVETGEGGDFAEPATNEDLLEALESVLTGGKDLAVGARVKLVPHNTVAVNNDLVGVRLEQVRLFKGLEAELLAPLSDNAHVAVCAGSLRNWRWAGRWGGSRSRRRARARRRLDWGRRRRSLVDRAGRGLDCLIGGRRVGGRSRRAGGGSRFAAAGGCGLGLAFDNVDGVHNSLNNNVKLNVVAAGRVATVRRGGERRASKGGNGEGEGGAHLVGFFLFDIR